MSSAYKNLKKYSDYTDRLIYELTNRIADELYVCVNDKDKLIDKAKKYVAICIDPDIDEAFESDEDY